MVLYHHGCQQTMVAIQLPPPGRRSWVPISGNWVPTSLRSRGMKTSLLTSDTKMPSWKLHEIKFKDTIGKNSNFLSSPFVYVLEMIAAFLFFCSFIHLKFSIFEKRFPVLLPKCAGDWRYCSLTAFS